MPFVNIKVAGKLTNEERKRLIVASAEMLEKELGKPKSSTYTVIEEIDPNAWGKGDESVQEIRDRS
jgi:4-oxalocrotonate tautomerase